MWGECDELYVENEIQQLRWRPTESFKASVLKMKKIAIIRGKSLIPMNM